MKIEETARFNTTVEQLEENGFFFVLTFTGTVIGSPF